MLRMKLPFVDVSQLTPFLLNKEETIIDCRHARSPGQLVHIPRYSYNKFSYSSNLLSTLPWLWASNNLKMESYQGSCAGITRWDLQEELRGF